MLCHFRLCSLEWYRIQKKERYKIEAENTIGNLLCMFLWRDHKRNRFPIPIFRLLKLDGAWMDHMQVKSGKEAKAAAWDGWENAMITSYLGGSKFWGKEELIFLLLFFFIFLLYSCFFSKQKHNLTLHKKRNQNWWILVIYVTTCHWCQRGFWFLFITSQLFDCILWLYKFSFYLDWPCIFSFYQFSFV